MLNIFPDNIFMQKYLSFSQGTEGDCWLLASIISLFHGGYDFEKLVQQTPDGNFIVNLFGFKNIYTINPKSFNKYPQLSFGAEVVKAIEIAVLKHMQKYLQFKKLIDVIDYSLETMYKTGIHFSSAGALYGNYAAFAFYILTGLRGNYYNIQIDEQYCKFVLKNINNYYITVSTRNYFKNSKMMPYHEYAVIGKYNNKLKLINPYNSLVTIFIDYEDLQKYNVNFFIAEKKQSLKEKFQNFYDAIRINGQKLYYEAIISYFNTLKRA